MKPLSSTFGEPRSDIEGQYLRLLGALVDAPKRGDRTGTGTTGLFGVQLRHDLEHGFPLLTTKKVHFHSVMHELLWMLSGSTNISYLKENNVTIWDEWADENGDLGPVYGAQWRAFSDPCEESQPEGMDQISEVIGSLRNDPESRRHIVSAWNPLARPLQALPPCHILFQFYAERLTVDERLELMREKADGNAATLGVITVPEYRLSCSVYMRSSDVFLGLPFNLAQYALLTHMVAACTGMQPGTLVMTLGDTHLYSNHRHQAAEQMRRAYSELPQLRLADPSHYRSSIFDIKPEHIDIVGYDPAPAIPAPVAV